MTNMIKAGRFLRHLRRDQSGLAITEFAMAAPVVLLLGISGMEVANFALASLRVSQITANLADTASRIGESSPLALKKIRETDINDAFAAVRLQSGTYNLTTHGRVILSSLEQNESGGQWVRWQRCIGLKRHNPELGTAGNGATGTAFQGMGPTGNKITAPPGTAVMFVEVAYDYQPVFNNTWFGPSVIKSQSAFLVRDQRDLTAGSNPANPAPAATAKTCNLYTAT